MKLYRVLANSFLSKGRLDEIKPTGLEGIYYNMGYASFRNERGYHAFNNIYKNITGNGKYFYLFFEDAFIYGNRLLNGLHNLNVTTFTIVEYNIPIEIVLKNIGYGDYTDSIFEEYAVETFINENDIIGKKLTTHEVSNDLKTKNFIRFFSETMKKLEEFKEYAPFDYRYYTNYFGCDLNELIDNQEELRKQIMHNPLLSTFLSSTRKLIETPYITEINFQINHRYFADKFALSNDFDEIKDYLKTKSIICDLSKDQRSFKDEILYYAGLNNNNTKDPEQIKKLLKSKNYNL